MTCLLDVNALVALGFQEHELHERVARWMRSLGSKDEFLVCSITELGFVRVLNQAVQYHVGIDDARALIARLKAARKRIFRFIADDHGVEQLPRWVKKGRQTTDGHLAELARANGAVLATLDEGIPGAFLIP
jgi:uncharacterized protein